MKKRLMAAVALALAASGSASAAIQTYDFTAAVTSLGDATSYTWVDSAETATAGISVSVGDAITGRISFDDAAAVSSWSPGTYVSPGAVRVAFTFVATGQQHAFVGNIIEVEDRALGPDAVTFTAPDTWPPSGYSSISLADPDGSALQGVAIPASLSLDAFPRSSVFMGWTAPTDCHQFILSARLDSLTAVSAVPEPSSVLLLLCGLSLIFATCRRRDGSPERSLNITGRGNSRIWRRRRSGQ